MNRYLLKFDGRQGGGYKQTLASAIRAAKAHKRDYGVDVVVTDANTDKVVFRTNLSLADTHTEPRTAPLLPVNTRLVARETSLLPEETPYTHPSGE